jgi:hypothetical protein
MVAVSLHYIPNNITIISYANTAKTTNSNSNHNCTFTFISTNFGDSWQRFPSPLAWSTLAIEDGSSLGWTMLASNPSFGVHYSHDRGVTWYPSHVHHVINVTSNEIHDFPFHVSVEKFFLDIGGKAATAIVYNGSIYRSEDRGISWQEIIYPRGAWIDIDGTDDGKVQYILSSGALVNEEGGRNSTLLADRGVHRSLDYGRTWSFVSDPFHGCPMRSAAVSNEDWEWKSLVVDGHVGNQIIVGSKYSRLFVSSDGGKSWRETPKERIPERMGIGGYIFYSLYAIALLYLIRKWGKKRDQMMAMAARRERYEDMVDEIELPAFPLDETPALAQATSVEGQIYTAIPCNDDEDPSSHGMTDVL